MQPTQLWNGTSRLDVSLELAHKVWKAAGTDGKRANPATFTVNASDLWERFQQLLQRLEDFRAKWGLPARCRINLIYEAGQDGFWIARALKDHGVQAYVVDAASLLAPTHKRRPKTDRLDALKLLEHLRAWLRGERHELRVLHIPSEESEASRHLSRERGLLQKEMTQHLDRVRKLLRLYGCTDELDRQFWERLHAGEVCRADGRPLPQELRSWLLREEERLGLARCQFVRVQKTLMEALPEPMQRCIAMLAQLKGVGWVSATRLVLELFWRDFSNRRQVGACVGLVAQPYSSGESQTDQGISKQGNRRVRALLIELAWLWIRYQPRSALARWFARRTQGGSKRGKRIAIVAVARRLAICLWRYLHDGVMPEGARLKKA